MSRNLIGKGVDEKEISLRAFEGGMKFQKLKWRGREQLLTRLRGNWKTGFRKSFAGFRMMTRGRLYGREKGENLSR